MNQYVVTNPGQFFFLHKLRYFKLIFYLVSSLYTILVIQVLKCLAVRLVDAVISTSVTWCSTNEWNVVKLPPSPALSAPTWASTRAHLKLTSDLKTNPSLHLRFSLLFKFHLHFLNLCLSMIFLFTSILANIFKYYMFFNLIIFISVYNGDWIERWASE